MTRLSKPRESNLKSQILEYIQILENQGKAYGDRLNSGEILALNKDGSQRLIKLCREGTADIFFIAYGRLIFTETKRKGEKQKPQQKIFQEKVESVGAIYWLVDNFDDFLKLLSEHGITV